MSSKLITAETFFNQDGVMGVTSNSTNIAPSLWASWRYSGAGNGQDFIPPFGDADDPKVAVFVERGMWMIQCPFGCGSAQVASETDHRFYCVSGHGGCGNYAVFGKTIPVVWPKPAFQKKLEDLLLERPQPFRNWRPWETISVITGQNERRGE